MRGRLRLLLALSTLPTGQHHSMCRGAAARLQATMLDFWATCQGSLQSTDEWSGRHQDARMNQAPGNGDGPPCPSCA